MHKTQRQALCVIPARIFDDDRVTHAHVAVLGLLCIDVDPDEHTRWTQAQVAQKMGVRREWVNKLIGELVAFGYLEKEPVPGGHRLTYRVLWNRGPLSAVDDTRIAQALSGPADNHCAVQRTMVPPAPSSSTEQSQDKDTAKATARSSLTPGCPLPLLNSSGVSTSMDLGEKGRVGDARGREGKGTYKKIAHDTPDPYTLDDLLSDWDDTAQEFHLPRVQSVVGARRVQALKRLHEHPDTDWWRGVWNAIRRSPFLKGKGRGREWRLSFDSLIRPSMLIKIVEGNFNHVEETPGKWRQR